MAKVINLDKVCIVLGIKKELLKKIIFAGNAKNEDK